MSSAKLYTPAMLAAAVELAQYPHRPHAALHGEARSATCGSTMAVDVDPDAEGNIGLIGLQIRACAVGQAAAAVFARHAEGKSAADLRTAEQELQRWLVGTGDAPNWPDLALIAPAIAFPARHGAMLLPWKAALSALSSAPSSS